VSNLVNKGAPVLRRALFILAIWASISPTSARAELFKVLTYNLWGLPGGFSKAPARRIDGFCEYLKAQDPRHAWDVVFFQEVWKPWMAERLKNCGYEHHLRLDEGSYETGLMILSRHRLTEGYRRIFRSTPTGWSAFINGESIATKGALMALVNHPVIGPVFVLNTHVVANYGLSTTFEDFRREQLIEAEDDAALRGAEMPQIFGGDLNIAPDGGSYTLLWEEFPRILPRFKRVIPRLPVSTRDRSNPYSDVDEGHIDHLFGRDGARPLRGTRVLDQPGSIFSDHYGWETYFEIEPRVI
jgi:endonuclease/exonuclease/phosphatase family metal-dependent hydrolase